LTTIAYRNGVLAADRRAYGGDKVPFGLKTKIHELADGTLFGSSSCSVGADRLIRRWLEDGCPAPKSGDLTPETFEAIVIRPNGDVYFACNNLELSGPVEAEYVAIGSGNQYALGAMAMGAGPERAVEIASELDVWSGGGVTVLRHEG